MAYSIEAFEWLPQKSLLFLWLQNLNLMNMDDKTLLKMKDCYYTWRIVRKMTSSLKFILCAKRQLPMKWSVKEILFQQLLKKIGRVARWYVTEFSWKTHCFYCESPCVPDPKYPERKKIGNVCTLSFRQSVLKNCHQRKVNGHRKWEWQF